MAPPESKNALHKSSVEMTHEAREYVSNQNFNYALSMQDSIDVTRCHLCLTRPDAVQFHMNENPNCWLFQSGEVTLTSIRDG